MGVFIFYPFGWGSVICANPFFTGWGSVICADPGYTFLFLLFVFLAFSGVTAVGVIQCIKFGVKVGARVQVQGVSHHLDGRQGGL